MTSDARTVLLESRDRWVGVGATVKKVIDFTGVSASELARRTGITYTTLRDHLLGKSPMPPWELDACAAALRLPVEVFELAPDDAVRWLLDHPDAPRGCLVVPQKRRTDRRRPGQRRFRGPEPSRPVTPCEPPRFWHAA